MTRAGLNETFIFSSCVICYWLSYLISSHLRHMCGPSHLRSSHLRSSYHILYLCICITSAHLPISDLHLKFSRERLRRVPFKNLLWYPSAHHHQLIIISSSSSAHNHFIIISSSSSSSSHHHHHLTIFIIFPLSLSWFSFLLYFSATAVGTKNVPAQPLSGKMRFSGQKVPKTEGFLRIFSCSKQPSAGIQLSSVKN